MKQLIKPPSLLAYALIIIISVSLAGIWTYINLGPVDPQSDTTIIFVVPRGQSPEVTANALARSGLINHPIAFKYSLARHGLSKKLQAGSFQLSPSMSSHEIALALTQGSLDVWVTLIEGWRREQITSALAEAIKQSGASFDQGTFLDITQGKEGFLFPDSYLIPLSATEAQIASILENTFAQKVTTALQEEIERSSFTLPEIITLASMVEREAKTETARKMVAGILINRLGIGMALQVDATLQYALGYDSAREDWWAPPLARDKTVDSPYNTYQYPGLPPAPICSPSLSSVKAVLDYTPSDNLYYITGKDGRMHYATNLEAHNRNIDQYLR